MISKKKDSLSELKNAVSKEVRIARELEILFGNLNKNENSEDKNAIESQIKSLKTALKKINGQIPELISEIKVSNRLPVQQQIQMPVSQSAKEKPKEKLPDKKAIIKEFVLEDLERETLRRIKKKEKKSVEKKERRPNQYVRTANKAFPKVSDYLIKKEIFKTLERDLIKANIKFMLKSYVSVILFTTLVSVFAAVLIFLFFMFFNVGVKLPIITLSSEGLGTRFLKTFWILFLIPAGTFIFMYLYPSLEKDSIGKKIDQELPFATIHMAAISGSMIDPTKIFSIITLTGEYPYLSKEFTKLMNSINILGYDFVSVLRNSAFNTASKRLVDLYNGLATTISSGGDLPKFFDERAEGLLFEYNLEREKSTRAAETFMDIYISVVIAAPMILMLLLMMMRISGLGLALSTNMITLVMVLGVSIINVVFLTFLQIRQSESSG